MSSIGGIPFQPVQRIDEARPSFRLQQKISAEVIQVSGDNVILGIDGVRVVGRLTSTDQAATLAAQQFAQFIVQDFSGEVVTLQLQPASTDDASSASAAMDQFIIDLLEHAGVDPDDQNVLIAKALLGKGLAVTSESVEELRNILDAFQGWGAHEAELVATLKAEGLPLTHGSLALVQKGDVLTSESFTQLHSALRALYLSNKNPQLANLLLDAMIALHTASVDWSTHPAIMAEQLLRAVSILGRSLESQLKELEEGKSISISDRGIPRGPLILALLQRELTSAGLHDIAAKLDDLVDGMRLMQFLNARIGAKTEEEPWLNLKLPLIQNHSSGQEPGSGHMAHLRVSYSPGQGDDDWTIDMGHTRLIIQVELEKEEFLEVDLSVVGRKIGAKVSASSHRVQTCAQAELPSLESGIKRLGFALESASCILGHPKETEKDSAVLNDEKVQVINLEV